MSFSFAARHVPPTSRPRNLLTALHFLARLAGHDAAMGRLGGERKKRSLVDRRGGAVGTTRGVIMLRYEERNERKREEALRRSDGASARAAVPAGPLCFLFGARPALSARAARDGPLSPARPVGCALCD